MNYKQFFHSMTYATRGIIYVWQHEQNFRIQCLVGIFVFALIFVFQLRRSEMIVVLLLILLVLLLELLNSAVEKLADVLKPRLSEQIEITKDIMAATVLLSSVGSFIIGLIIFLPHIVEVFSQH